MIEEVMGASMKKIFVLATVIVTTTILVLSIGANFSQAERLATFFNDLSL